MYIDHVNLVVLDKIKQQVSTIRILIFFLSLDAFLK